MVENSSTLSFALTDFESSRQAGSAHRFLRGWLRVEDVQGNLQQLCKTMASVKQKKTKKLVGVLFCNGFWMKQMMMDIRTYVFFLCFVLLNFWG